MKTPHKACLYDRNGRKDSNGTSISTNLAKREIVGKKEGRRDNRGGGGGRCQQKGGFRKIRKKSRREKKREQKLIFSLDSLFVHWEICFSQSKCLFFTFLAFNHLSNLPIVEFTPFYLEISCVD